MTEKLTSLIKSKPLDARGNFHLTGAEYRALTLEEQKTLDKNYWRFPWKGGYDFNEMTDREKAMFADQEMVIHHSIFED